MPIDAGMGATAAIAELLVQQRRDGLHVLPGIPRDWRELELDGNWAEGGFHVDSTILLSVTTEVRVTVTRDQHLRLHTG